MGVRSYWRLAGLCILPALALAQQPSLIDILAAELQRSFSSLQQKADPRPYYLAYSAADVEMFSASASLGALRDSDWARRRVADVTVRVGSPQLDNYRRVRDDVPRFSNAVPLALEDHPAAIRRSLWHETDRTYRQAAQRFIKIKTDQQVQVASQDDSPDFSQEQPAVAAVPVPPLKLNQEEWERRVRKWSAAFQKYAEVQQSSISVAAQRDVRYLVNSEGTRLQYGRDYARIVISAQARAADGMDLSTGDSFEAVNLDGLPGDKQVLAAVEAVGSTLTRLLRAPVVDPYVGPAILSGRAAGVFFHEIFGHRIEGHRQKDEREGQTFTKAVGSPVLPEFLSVVFDPTRRRFGEVDLNGWYDYDDEGVKAAPVTSVENGILKTFLLSRSPVKGFPKSNGHGRRQFGFEVFSRQSNLIVNSARTVPEARLRELLISEVRLQNKPYGLYFEEVTGGFTTTARRGLQAFAVIPRVVYRVYPDGRPDELVRGVDIVGTPLTSFAKIMATSDRPVVFNGYCGAESGSVPVAAVSPALLVSEIEVQRKPVSMERPPLLPRPSVGND